MTTFKLNNIAAFLPKLAQKKPYQPAIFFPSPKKINSKRTYLHYTYEQLNNESDIIAAGLLASGFKPGMRTILMVKPSLAFFALVFALFKAKIVPVIIDPGLGKSKLKKAINRIEAEGFIGIPIAHVARILLGWGRSTIHQLVTVGPRIGWGGTTLENIQQKGKTLLPFVMDETDPDEMAAILFTSGSTGIPKGTIYSHGNFIAQVDSIKRLLAIQSGEIDLPTFPLFALFDPALEMTSVIPDMDFSKPAKANPLNLLEIINDFGPTNMFASPALLDRLGRYGVEHHILLPSLKRVITAGAAVQPKVIARFKQLLSADAEIFTPYGATESLPVSVINANDILANTQDKTKKGLGICVGKIDPELDVKIIKISDDPIASWSHELEVEQGAIGEIVVSGPQVTKGYFNMKDETTKANIIKEKNNFYHRMGDLGYFDDNNHLWYCGRKSHRVVTSEKVFYTENCEGIFNCHPAIFRTGLIAASIKGKTEAVLCVELEKNTTPTLKMKEELQAIADNHVQTKGINKFIFCKQLPVDIRHNAKIIRETLAEWVKKGELV